jgi:ketosteroid isomerase-like protein
MYEDEIEMGKGTLDLKTLEVLHQGDYAYETGLYDIQMTVNQELIQDNGKYIVVWERQSDGQWLCKKDIWNTNLEQP